MTNYLNYIYYNLDGDKMKKIIRSIDVLLFLIIIIFILNYLFSRKIISFNYNKSTYNLLNNLPLMTNLYKYNELLPVIKEIPSVYIYNTHYEEEYSNTNVIEISKILNEKLNQIGINSIFEDTNYNEYRIVNKLIGVNNYVMLRKIIENNIKYNDISLIIDLHRDSINKNESTIKINNKEYAKVLFVVDNSSKDYLKKQELANKLNKYLNNYKGLSRGVYVKNGKGFNQDLSNNMILLELGGYQNTKDELINTINIIVDMIKGYINER